MVRESSIGIERLRVAAEEYADWAQRLSLMVKTGRFSVSSKRAVDMAMLLDNQQAIIESAVQGLKDFEKFGD